MSLFEIKLILEPTALLVIRPVWVMPVLVPAAALLPVTVILPPPALMVMIPKETTVVDTPPVPVTVRLFAVMVPVAVIGTRVAVADCDANKVTAPPLIAPVVLIPAPAEVVVTLAVVVLIVIACPVAVRLPLLE